MLATTRALAVALALALVAATLRAAAQPVINVDPDELLREAAGEPPRPAPPPPHDSATAHHAASSWLGELATRVGSGAAEWWRERLRPMLAEDSESELLARVNAAFTAAKQRLLRRAADVARPYIESSEYKTVEQRLEAMVESQCRLNGGAGFLGGLFGLAGFVPAVVASLSLQYTMAASIAIVRGYNASDAHTEALIFTALVGDAGTEALKLAAAQPTRIAGAYAMQQLAISRLLSASGQRAVESVGARAVPVVGSVVATWIDYTQCKRVAAFAQEHVFGPPAFDDPIELWDRDAVRLWVSSVGLPQYMDRLFSHHVSGEVLLSLTEADLEKRFQLNFGEARMLITRREQQQRNSAARRSAPAARVREILQQQ